MPKYKNNLKKLRERNNYSLEYIAKRIDSTSATISRYETGQRKINSDNLLKLSKLFNVTPEFLLGEEDTSQRTIRTKEDLKKENMAFFEADDISDEDKEEIFQQLQEFYFREKLKKEK